MSSGKDISKKSSNSNVPNPHGLKLVKSLVETMHNWIKYHIPGITMCRDLADRNFSEVNKGFVVERLAFAVKEMIALVENMEVISGQLGALAKLIRSDDPLFNTWSGTQLASQAEGISEMFHEETKLKLFVAENIAHCDDENMMEVLKSVWQFNTQLNENIIETFKKEAQL